MTWLQRTSWAIFVGLFGLAIVMVLGGDLDLRESSIPLLSFLAMGPIGAWISLRRPKSPIGWLFLAAGSLGALIFWASQVVEENQATGGAWAGATLWAAWWISFPWYVVMSLIVVYVPLLFPDGPASSRWRTIVISLAVLQVLVFVAVACATQTLEPAAGVTVPNPLALPSSAVEEAFGAMLGGLWGVLLLVGLILGVISLGQRYRRSTGVQRQQLLWLMAAAAFLLSTFLFGIALAYWLPADHWAALAAEYVLMSLGIITLPLACGVAILRYRLYDIDRIISRTLAFGLMSAAVLGTYALVVTLVTQLLPVSSTLPVAAATLASAAAFRPVLTRVQALVDRRFNRSRYDAQQMADAFAARMRAEVDGDEVVEDLLAVLDRTVQPRVAGVWLREPSR